MLKWNNMEQELSSFVEAMKYHQSINYSGKMIIKTFNNNLTHTTAQLSSPRLLH